MNGKLDLFRNLQNLYYMSIRTCKELPKGIKYYGFTYYPRHENFKDPPCEPSKLFFIKRIKSVKGTTKIEKSTLRALNICGSGKNKDNMNVVKNTVYTNALLWKVKHLIEVKPIIIKGEMPKDGDFTGTYLRETGEFIVSPKLKISPSEIECSDKYHNDKTRFKRAYLKNFLKKKWLNGFSGGV